MKKHMVSKFPLRKIPYFCKLKWLCTGNRHQYPTQCCEFALDSMRIRIQHFRSLRGWIWFSGVGSGLTIWLRTQKLQNFTVENKIHILKLKIIRLQRRKSKVKENIRTFKTIHFFTFSFFVVIPHLGPDPDPGNRNQCGSGFDTLLVILIWTHCKGQAVNLLSLCQNSVVSILTLK